MSMTRLALLANSWKHSDWCLAGIDLKTGNWVRPVTNTEDGRVPKAAMQLDGYFPKLLDVIALPLAATGPDYGFEKENRLLLPGKWRHEGKLTPRELAPYAETPTCVLHNNENNVPLETLRQKPPDQRISLQLIRVDDFRVRAARKKVSGEMSWQGVFTTANQYMAIRITDPMFVGKLSAGYQPAASCLLTMSLSMPYKPPDWDDDRSPACWKLIAGVIELLES